MMRTLVLDTSTERGIVAYFENGRMIFTLELPKGMQNSKFLLPHLSNKLDELGIALKNIQGIIVGIGPGSYTGIRVGAIVAKTLASALNIPLIGVCTLDAFIPDNDSNFAAVIDAKVGGVYLQIGRRHNNKIHYETPLVLPLADAAKKLIDCEVLVTPQLEPLQSKLNSLLPKAPKWEEKYPSVERLHFLGMKKYDEGNYSKEGHLELMYMRKTQAEIERESNSP